MEGKGEISREADVVNSISRLYLESEYADLIFIVDGDKLPAHRSILAASCEYFRGLLFGGFAESKQHEIKLDEPLAAFKLILKYIYTGRVSLTESSVDEVIDLLHLTHKFGLKNPLSDVTKSLCKRLNKINVCDVLTAASVHSMEELETAALAFIDKNAKAIENTRYNSLSKELISKIISRNEFPMPELDIFKMVMAWGEKKPKEDLKSVLSNVRFTLLQIYELREIVEPTGALEMAELNDIIQQIKTVDALPFRDAKLHRNQFQYWTLNEKNEMQPHMIPTSDTYIMFGLKSCMLVNYIFMELSSKFRLYYNIDVFTDKKDWHRVVTFENCSCYGNQHLFFDFQSVRYVCVHFLGSVEHNIKSFRIEYNIKKIPVMIDGFVAPQFDFGIQSFLLPKEENESKNTQRIGLSQPAFVNCIYCEDFANKVVLKLESTRDYKNYKDLPLQLDASNKFFFFDPHVVEVMRITFRNLDTPLGEVLCFFSNSTPNFFIK